MRIFSKEIAEYPLINIRIKHPVRPYYSKGYMIDTQGILAIIPLTKCRYRITCITTGLTICDVANRGNAWHVTASLLDKMERNKQFHNAIVKTTIAAALAYKKSGKATQNIKLIQAFLYKYVCEKKLIREHNLGFKYSPEYIIHDPILPDNKR